MPARAQATRAPRRRPAARRRPAPRRRGSRINWDRLGRVALTIVLAAVLFSYLNPLLSFVHTYRGSSAAKAHLHELVVENKRLHRRVQSTDDPAVLERQARRQGMIKPGERPYVVHGLNG
jgi:cell division protein FtsB